MDHVRRVVLRLKYIIINFIIIIIGMLFSSGLCVVWMLPALIYNACQFELADILMRENVTNILKLVYIFVLRPSLSRDLTWTCSWSCLEHRDSRFSLGAHFLNYRLTFSKGTKLLCQRPNPNLTLNLSPTLIDPIREP